MKKFIALILTVSILFCVAGCKLPVNDEAYPTETTAPGTEPDSIAELPTVAQLPMTAISLPVITQSEYAETDVEIFRYSYQDISLVVPDPEVADKIIVDYLNHSDIQEEADKILTAAKNDYAEKADNWTPYLAQALYKPTRVDQSVLSINGEHTFYTGGAHPETAYSSLNYDMLTGDALTLADILSSDVSAETICQMVVSILHEQKETAYFPDFEETVKSRFEKSLTDDFDWYFGFRGIVFYFEPYSIAPYASGMIQAEIPYTQLSGILKDDYFPRETDVALGTVMGTKHDQNLDQYTQTSEIVLDKDGDQILLYTNQMVQNLDISTVVWSSGTTAISHQYYVFATDNLTPGDAILVQADLSEDPPTLLLTYESNGKITRALISLDSANNTVTLTEL